MLRFAIILASVAALGQGSATAFASRAERFVVRAVGSYSLEDGQDPRCPARMEITAFLRNGLEVKAAGEAYSIYFDFIGEPMAQPGIHFHPYTETRTIQKLFHRRIISQTRSCVGLLFPHCEPWTDYQSLELTKDGAGGAIVMVPPQSTEAGGFPPGTSCRYHK